MAKEISEDLKKRIRELDELFIDKTWTQLDKIIYERGWLAAIDLAIGVVGGYSPADPQAKVAINDVVEALEWHRDHYVSKPWRERNKKN